MAPGSSAAADRPADRAGSCPERARREARPEAAGSDDALLVAAAGGDRAACDSLVSSHMGWVAEAARARAGGALSEGDLVQEGSIGLLRAIREFEPARGTFEGFARARVAAEMDRALESERATIRQAEMLVEAAAFYERAEVKLRAELGREPAASELGDRLEWTVVRVEEVARLVREARRRHDEELLPYLQAELLDLALPGEEP